MTETVERSDYMKRKITRLLENNHVRKQKEESGPFTDVYHVDGDSDTYTVMHHKEDGIFDCPCQYGANNDKPCSHAAAVEEQVRGE